jgi:hypothetical protein
MLGKLASTIAACAPKIPGGPVLDLLAKVENGDYVGLVNYEFNYNDFATLPINLVTNEFKYARQIHALFSKLDFLELGYDLTSRTLDKFVESEDSCLWTNRKILYNRSHPKNWDATTSFVLNHASRKIAKVLGEFCGFGAFEPSFGPGANTTVKGHSSSARLKLGAMLACSDKLVPYLGEHLADAPAWVAVHADSEDVNSWFLSVAVTPGKLTFVPKNAKIHRSIIVEPVLNSYIQKGVGSYIRSRLKAFGVDLLDQSFNQELARYGSVTGDVATVDLSSASDTISKELVYELLPLDWAEALDQIRTHVVTYKGVDIHLEKFSSMGNGFTFELESLIFWALAKGVCACLKIDSTLVNVYGDDIIIPAGANNALSAVLKALGFSVNKEKSFSKGPFRESCGADFYNGIDIRPFYFKTRVSDRTLYTAHNWFLRRNQWELAAAVESMIRGEKLYGPDGFGDGHLIGDYTLRRNRSMKRAGWCGGFFDTFSLKPRSNSNASKGDRAFPTYSVYTRSGALDPTDPNVVRGSSGYAKVSIYMLPGQ